MAVYEEPHNWEALKAAGHPGPCPKCGSYSGDDWSHCPGSCPMAESPHYNISREYDAWFDMEPVAAGAEIYNESDDIPF